MRVLSQVSAALVAVACGAASVQAAFIVEPGSGGKANANFSVADGAPSTSGAGTAVGLSGSASVFGGSGSDDVWTFSYTPGVDVDNTVIAAGTVLGTHRIDPPGNPAGVVAEEQVATGLEGGVSGTYKVYTTWIGSGNVDVAGSTFTITSDGAPIVLNPVDQNAFAPNGPTASGEAGWNKWLLIGTVELTAGNTYTVVQDANNPSFVSQRSAGVMWELQPAGIPEPSSIALVGLAAAGLAVVVRRRVA